MQRTLTTTRLTLRPLVQADASWITHTVRLPQIYRNLAHIAENQSEDTTSAFIARANEGEEAGTDIVRLIERESAPLGLVGVHRKTHTEPFELGYWLHPDYWGDGVMSEATKAYMNWLDGFVSPRFYMAGYFYDNPASGAILRKLGFLPTWRRPVFCQGRQEEVDHIDMSRIPDQKDNDEVSRSV